MSCEVVTTDDSDVIKCVSDKGWCILCGSIVVVVAALIAPTVIAYGVVDPLMAGIVVAGMAAGAVIISWRYGWTIDRRQGLLTKWWGSLGLRVRSSYDLQSFLGLVVNERKVKHHRLPPRSMVGVAVRLAVDLVKERKKYHMEYDILAVGNDKPVKLWSSMDADRTREVARFLGDFTGLRLAE